MRRMSADHTKSKAVPGQRIQDAQNLAWLDLEMTGLDPERDVILQAALIVTDAELEPLFRSAEGYIRMWELSEQRAAELGG